MPGEPEALTELSLNILREQLALQGVYVVSTTEKAVLEAMAAISDADLNSCFLSYLRPGLMAACEAEFAHRRADEREQRTPGQRDQMRNTPRAKRGP